MYYTGQLQSCTHSKKVNIHINIPGAYHCSQQLNEVSKYSETDVLISPLSEEVMR